MIYSILVLIMGIHIGQEYDDYLPSIKNITFNTLSYLRKNNIEQKDTYFSFLKKNEKLTNLSCNIHE